MRGKKNILKEVGDKILSKLEIAQKYAALKNSSLTIFARDNIFGSKNGNANEKFTFLKLLSRIKAPKFGKGYACLALKNERLLHSS